MGLRSSMLLAVAGGLVVLLAALAGPSSAQLPVPVPRLEDTLIGNVLPELGQATPVSPAPSSQRMRIGILVSHPHQRAEAAALRQLYNPRSAHFHRFFTPSTYAKQFGVSSSNAQAVRDWLASKGLRVDYVSGARDYFLASGTAAQVESLTGSKLGLFTFAGQRFLANTSAPRVPAGLHVRQILGLNTYQRFHTMYEEGQALGKPAASPNIGSQSPRDLWSIYEQPKSQIGKGVSVAILGNGATDSVIKDLHQFDKQN